MFRLCTHNWIIYIYHLHLHDVLACPEIGFLLQLPGAEVQSLCYINIILQLDISDYKYQCFDKDIIGVAARGEWSAYLCNKFLQNNSPCRTFAAIILKKAVNLYHVILRHTFEWAELITLWIKLFTKRNIRKKVMT